MSYQLRVVDWCDSLEVGSIYESVEGAITDLSRGIPAQLSNLASPNSVIRFAIFQLQVKP